jgi:hypothetical protein
MIISKINLALKKAFDWYLRHFTRLAILDAILFIGLLFIIFHKLEWIYVLAASIGPVSRHFLRIHFAKQGNIPKFLGGNRGMEKIIEGYQKNAQLKVMESSNWK